MTLLDAAEKVINDARRPMGVKELCERILKARIWETTGKTPEASLSAQLAVHVKNGGTRFVKCAPGVFGVPGMTPLAIPAKKSVKAKNDRRSAKNAPGYVYIMTNPSFRKSWIKIGFTSGGIESVEQRRRELSNSSVPFPFEVYAVLKSFNAYDTERRIHLALEAGGDSRLTPNREFFDLPVERALKAFKAVASDEAITYYRDGHPVKDSMSVRCVEVKALKQKEKKRTVLERWENVTQLAKIIARRGGNEGAFGGVLQYFAPVGSKSRKPCSVDSKWRQPLEDAGVKFDKNDFVKSLDSVKNPL